MVRCGTDACRWPRTTGQPARPDLPPRPTHTARLAHGCSVRSSPLQSLLLAGAAPAAAEVMVLPELAQTFRELGVVSTHRLARLTIA